MTLTRSPGFWLAMLVAGTLIPGYFTLQFSLEKLAQAGGANLTNFALLSPWFYQTAMTSHVSLQLLFDIIICTIMFFIWMFPEGQRLGMKHLWIYPLLTYGLAFSLAIPLFMYNRARRLKRSSVNIPEYSI